MGFFRWLWYLLFPPSAPAFPPEHAETRALWREAQRLAAAARLSLSPGDWSAATAARLCEERGLDPDDDLAERLTALVEALLEASGLYDFPPDAALDYALSDLAEGVRLREELRQKILFLKQPEHYEGLTEALVTDLLAGLLSVIEAPPSESGRAGFRVPLLSCVPDIGGIIGGLVARVYAEDIRRTPLFTSLRDRLLENLEAVSKEPVSPAEYVKKKGLEPVEALDTFLRGTPFLDVFAASLPFAIPEAARFEHLHVLAGSGHGKTQALQMLILADIERAKRERFGFALIDSQGDLIDKLTRLDVFEPEDGPLADRLILIDPNDIRHPAGLNLFDYDLDRFQSFSEVEREKIFFGVIDLYTYLFSSLLGAELTQKQGVVFTHLARAMLSLPHPTIYTLYDFVEDGSQFRPHLEKLDGAARRFFDKQFFAPAYNATRQQILTRLDGILANPVLERMFAHPKNHLDLFGAMQDGKIVVINTAKDLLKTEGSALLGRFFVALTVQATLARAAVRERDRTPFHLYLDEAQEYFDQKTAELLTQGRKYRVGVTLAHQDLKQLDTQLRATVKGSVSIRLAGGVNHDDALELSKEMQCSPAYIQGMRKHERRGYTEFACYVRHHTPHPVTLAVPFGAMERLPAMSAPAYMQLLDANRARVARMPELPAPSPAATAGGAEGLVRGEPGKQPPETRMAADLLSESAVSVAPPPPAEPGPQPRRPKARRERDKPVQPADALDFEISVTPRAVKEEATNT
jgi:hypothetical protein